MFLASITNSFKVIAASYVLLSKHRQFLNLSLKLACTYFKVLLFGISGWKPRLRLLNLLID